MSKYLDFFSKRCGGTLTPNDRNEVLIPCVLHKDTAGASLSINVETGKWKCHVPYCPGHKGGGYKKFAQIQDGEIPGTNVVVQFIDKAEVEAHHKVLLNSSNMMAFLRNKRGFTEETIRRFKLGWDADRVWIPIQDKAGNYVNVRKYKSGAEDDKMIAYGGGYNRARLFPAENLELDELVIAEGETDCILANQYGIDAITTTGGADTWSEEFSRELKGKRVYLCFDCDKAGKQGARQIAIKLLPYAAEVYIINLNLRGTKAEKDITNYFVDLGHSVDDFNKLKDAAERVEASVEQKGPSEELTQIHLSQIGEERLVGKRVEATVLAAGKDLAPFQVPRTVAYSCEMGQKICDFCGICKNGGQLEVKLPEWSPTYLRMVNTPMEKIGFILSEMAEVPNGCQKYSHEVKEFANIESIKFIPEIDFESAKSEYVIRSLFYLGHGLETNRTYKIKAVVMPDPKTQYATALIYDVQASQDSLEKFELDKGVLDLLNLFRVQ